MTVAFARAFALVAGLAFVTACTKVGTAGGDAGTRHPYTHAHELRFSSAEDITGLNPLSATQATVMEMAAMTMAWLIKTDEHGEPTVPELITEIPSKANGGIGADGKSITWHLRRGVVWSDGAPFTADDVVFSTRTILDPKTTIVSRDGWDQIARIDEPDKYTVVYHLKKPYGAFAVTYFSTGNANPAILPAHLLAGKNVNTDPYNALPIGIGPFKYSAWKRGDSVVMVPNARYFRGAPKLQRITYELIQDRNVVLEQLRTHELDLWIPVAPHFINDVRAIPGTKVVLDPSYFYDHIDFNMQHPAMADIAVRRALRMAVDRKTLNEKIRFGLFDLGESVVPPVSRFHENLPMVPFDVAGANRLLDAAGWTRGADGVRAKNGRRLSLDFATASGSPDSDSQLELIRLAWKQLGVDFQLHHYLSSILFAPASQGGIIYGGKFDAVVFGWGGDPNQDLSNLYACYRFPPDGQNDPRYCDRDVTAAIDRAKVEYDRDKRTADMAFVQRRIADDAPTIVLDTRKQIAAYNDDLTGWKPNVVAPFDDMLRVDI